MRWFRTSLPFNVLGAIVLMLLLSVFVGCRTLFEPRIIQWDHTMLESEFSVVEGGDYLEYRYEDERFNSSDMFDMYEIGEDGLSHWEAYYDAQAGVFFSSPVYRDGSVRWNAHPISRDVVAGRTVRFYRIRTAD